MTPSEFVAQFLPQAQGVSQATGLPVNFVLGQSALETGWGTSNAAVNGNNYFGISPSGNLASYPSQTAGFSAYSNLINSPTYSGVSSVVGQGSQAIGDYLNGQGYSTTPNYGSRVAGTTATVDRVMNNPLNHLGLNPVVGKSPASGIVATVKQYAFGSAVVLIAIVFIVVGLAALALKQEPHQVIKGVFA